MTNLSVLCISVVFLAVVTAATAAAPQKYTTKYDNINIDQILTNGRLLNTYIKCLLDKDKCMPEAEELKKHIRDALENGCKKCSQKQREGTDKVFRFLMKNKPKEFKELENKYDPKGTYRARYQAEATKRGIKI